jgi:hypothetical protein
MKNPFKNIIPNTDESLKKENEQLKQEIERLNAVNADLQKLAEASPVKEQAPVTADEMLKLGFELEKVKYGFNFTSAMYKGRKITAEDVVADVQLQAELVSKRSGMIKQL